MNLRYIAATFAAAAAVSVSLLVTQRAEAITFGQPDSDNRFSNVGAIIAVADADFLGVVATGILIHPRVLLTAGHATAHIEFLVENGFATHDDGRVSFAADATDPDTWHEIQTVVTYPGFSLAPESKSQDIGVVILKQPVNLPCAVLPYVGLLDDLQDAGLLRQGGVPTKLLNVGYGATLDFPPPDYQPGDGLRRFSLSEFQALENVWLQQNVNPANGNGGTGFGDSGGPHFWIAPSGELVLVALQSRGNAQLVGLNKAYRLDLAAAHDFVDFVLELVESGAL